MSWYAAIESLRAQAQQYRQGDHDVSSAQLEFAQEVFRIFNPRVLAAIRAVWAAEVLEGAADGFEAEARAAATLITWAPDKEKR